jgi:hypothetical protein
VSWQLSSFSTWVWSWLSHVIWPIKLCSYHCKKVTYVCDREIHPDRDTNRQICQKICKKTLDVIVVDLMATLFSEKVSMLGWQPPSRTEHATVNFLFHMGTWAQLRQGEGDGIACAVVNQVCAWLFKKQSKNNFLALTANFVVNWCMHRGGSLPLYI